MYNTGKGIHSRDIPLIFNRYTVLDNVETNSVKGLSSRNGLGLAICKSMVDLHDGSIDVRSEVDRYAEFTVRLPAAKLPETDAGQFVCETVEDRDLVEAAIVVIEENINNIEFTPEDLADNLRVSMRSLYRRFKEMDLLPPKDFIKKQRITHAARMIVKTNFTIQEIMYRVGFTTKSHFYKEFAKRYHQSPKDYRESHKDDTPVK